ncbi:Alp7A family actin-like protein [Lactococcus petauri]|uniref:Alp7A family actin-like protein n=1 Tax=Lactococcus petauri TaxID=1940789 RepID=UPI0038554A9F
MNIFAIDLGNHRIKMKSDRGEYNYPASYLSAEHVGVRSISGIMAEDNFCYELEEDKGYRFLWGEDLGIYNLTEKIIEAYARSGRMKQKKAQRILKFALGRLALDYKESRNKPLIVHLMLGVPVTDLHEESETIALLHELVVGQHHIQIDDEEIMVEIPSIDYISIVPQYMGTVMEMAFDENMQQVDTYAKGKIGLVDIGGGTILINSVNHMTPSPVGTESFEGVNTLIKEIATKVNSTKKFSIEQTLRVGNKKTGYIYRPNRNEADTRDITEIVENEIEKYTRFTVAPLVTSSFPDLEEVDMIVLTGGGVNVISHQALLDEIGERYISRLVFVENAEQANVRGFYKGACLLWKDSKEAPRETVALEERIMHPLEALYTVEKEK